MNCYVFTEEPSGVWYEELIRFCCLTADEMLLVTRNMDVSSVGNAEIMLRLSAFELRSEFTERWPGTKLLNRKALVRHYRVGAEVAVALLGMSSSLFDWTDTRGYPEDLCFTGSDGTSLLVNTTHEQDAYMYLTDSDLEIIGAQTQSLRSILRFEGKVTLDWARGNT